MKRVMMAAWLALAMGGLACGVEDKQPFVADNLGQLESLIGGEATDEEVSPVTWTSALSEEGSTSPQMGMTSGYSVSIDSVSVSGRRATVILSWSGPSGEVRLYWDKINKPNSTYGYVFFPTGTYTMTLRHDYPAAGTYLLYARIMQDSTVSDSETIVVE